MGKAEMAIGLLSSMVRGGESHSLTSEKAIQEGMDEIAAMREDQATLELLRKRADWIMATARSHAMPIVDLGKYRPPNGVYAGSVYGEYVRSCADLDRRDDHAEQVVVIVPLDTVTVTSSFFMGMFAPSIRRLGLDGFRERYRFEGEARAIQDLLAELGD